MSKKPVGHKARKRFGQNFLQDQGVINRIIRAISPRATDHLVEIGPGLGALTEEILNAAGDLDAIELDRDLVPILRTKFFSYGEHFRVHQADAMKFDYTSLCGDQRPLRIVGNLPYNISTQLIFHLLNYNEQIADMHFMLQKEVVERLAAKAGEKHYGRLSIMAQYYCQVENLFLVPPESFNPVPKVDSAIVRLTPYKQLPLVAKDVSQLQSVVRTAFNQRRKTLRNNLRDLISAEALESIEINPGERPERLTLQEFIRISDFLCDQEKGLTSVYE